MMLDAPLPGEDPHASTPMADEAEAATWDSFASSMGGF